MYDYRAGLLWGQIGATLYLAEPGDGGAGEDTSDNVSSLVGEGFVKQGQNPENSKTVNTNQKTTTTCTQLSKAKGKAKALAKVGMASAGTAESTGTQGGSVQTCSAVMPTWLQRSKVRAKAKEKAYLGNQTTNIMANQVATTMVIGHLENAIGK